MSAQFGEAYDNGLTVALNGATAEPLPYQDPKVLADNAWMGPLASLRSLVYQACHGSWFRKLGVTAYNPNHAAKVAVDATFEARKVFHEVGSGECPKGLLRELRSRWTWSHGQISHASLLTTGTPILLDESNSRRFAFAPPRSHDIEIQGKSYGWTLGMHFGKIDSQTYLGVQMTYDIEMDHLTHNFVADGVVVHNSQR